MRNGESENLAKIILPRYLADVSAAEKGFEVQFQTMSKQGGHEVAHGLFAEHVKEIRERRWRLSARLKAIGGSESEAKSIMATVFGLVPKSAQIGHDRSEKSVQNLIMAFSIASGEVAMYEALAAVAGTASDSETELLARTIQEEERAMAGKVWHLIAPAARESFKDLTHVA